MQPLVFLVIANDLDHVNTESRAIGGSEFQFYSLINLLQHKYKITCYNKKKETVVLENVTYKNLEELVKDELASDTTIIVGRCLPHLESPLYNKMKKNRIYLWWQDYVHRDGPSSRVPFLVGYSEESGRLYSQMNAKDRFRNDILIPMMETKQLHHVFNSTYSKTTTISFFSEFGLQLDPQKCHMIYNCIYPKNFVDRPLSHEINVNQIVYASAWTKGLSMVLDLFKYISAKDPNFQLVLMSPGYEWDTVKQFIPSLKQNFGNRVIIQGPSDKLKYSEIIAKSLCVMSARFPETFGCVFAESCFLGTPVIADIYSGAVREMIDPGFIVNYDNKDQVFRKLVEIRNQRTKMSIELRDEFKVDHILQQWIDRI